MRSSKPAAAKCCWSMSCRASAPPRWSIARAEARRERGGEAISGGAVVGTVAGSRRMGGYGGCLRDPDRRFAALVDDAGRDLRGRVPGLHRAVLRRQSFLATANASDLAA